jgi:hypothetical protein
MFDTASNSVKMIFAFMAIKRRLQTEIVEEHGRRLTVVTQHGHGRGSRSDNLGRPLAAWLNSQNWKDRNNKAAWIVAHYVTHRPFASPLQMDPEFPITHQWQIEFQYNPRGREIAIKLDERGQMLDAFMQLYESGNEDRLKCCPNCQRFFFAAGRRDKRTCSDNCRASRWQKTPAGRKTRREYMRDLRAKHRLLWKGNQRGRTLKRGRKLHIDLKKGE